MAAKKEIENKAQPLKEKKTTSKTAAKDVKAVSKKNTEIAKNAKVSSKPVEASKKNTNVVKKNDTNQAAKTAKTTKTATTTSKTNKSSRNTSSSKNLKKQAKKSDDRIKQILSEQLANIKELEINTNVKESVRQSNIVKLQEKEINNVDTNTTKTFKNEKTENVEKSEKNEKKKFLNTRLVKRESKNEKENEESEYENLRRERPIFKSRQRFDPKAVEVKIEKKRKLPEEEKKRIIKKIWINFLVASIMSLFLLFLNLGFKNIESDKFVVDLKVFSIILISITIFLFEKAYKKDSGTEALYGIECFVLAAATLVLAYIKIAFQIHFIKVTAYLNVAFSLYYSIKSIIIFIKEIKKYKNSISDIKEIVEEE